MEKEFIAKLLTEREDLQAQRIMLENSDDRLFSNVNGNLNIWKEAGARIRVIDKLLEGAV